MIIWCIFSTGSATQQRVQPVSGHVERRSDCVRQPQWNLPIQRRRRYQRANTERCLHVPTEPLERNLF